MRLSFNFRYFLSARIWLSLSNWKSFIFARPFYAACSFARIIYSVTSALAIGLRNKALARIQFVSPNYFELFYLRLLILKSSFKISEDAKTLEGNTFNTYSRTSLAASLYVDGKGYHTSFEVEMCILPTPSMGLYHVKYSLGARQNHTEGLQMP